MFDMHLASPNGEEKLWIFSDKWEKKFFLKFEKFCWDDCKYYPDLTPEGTVLESISRPNKDGISVADRAAVNGILMVLGGLGWKS